MVNVMLKIRYTIGASRWFSSVDSSQPRSGGGGLNSHSLRAAVRSVLESSVPSAATIRMPVLFSFALSTGAPSPPMAGAWAESRYSINDATASCSLRSGSVSCSLCSLSLRRRAHIAADTGTHTPPPRTRGIL